jgi:hypothetical protein
LKNMSAPATPKIAKNLDIKVQSIIMLNLIDSPTKRLKNCPQSG